jgi:hypothetical protein
MICASAFVSFKDFPPMAWSFPFKTSCSQRMSLQVFPPCFSLWTIIKLHFQIFQAFCHGTVLCIGNALNFCSRDTWLESRPSYLMYYFPWLSSVLSGICRHYLFLIHPFNFIIYQTASIRSCPFPNC